MAIQNRPTQNASFLEFARFWQPSSSSTVVWIEDMTQHRKLNFVRWGNQIYVPTYEGMELGIGVYNGAREAHAYPTYIEAKNLWDGGPAEPNACSPDHLWELLGGQQMIFDKVMAQSQTGRPLIVTKSGFGHTVGEATFQTQEFRGQIRVYERTEFYVQPQYNRPTNEGGSRGVTRSSSGGTRSMGGGESAQSYGAESLGLPSGVQSKGIDTGKAGIGLGAETYQQHVDTGRRYNRDAQPVISAHIEFREDLQDMLNNRFGYNAWNWHFDAVGSNWWNDRPYTANQVPVIGPHRPR